MLYKTLKKNILEQNENEQKNQKLNTKSIPRKARRDIELAKTTSDGIGNETYDIAIQVAKFLGTILPTIYPEIRKVEAEKSVVVIKNAAKLLKGNKSKEFINVIQMYVTAILGTRGMKKFNITGPFPANRDVNLVFQIAN